MDPSGQELVFWYQHTLKREDRLNDLLAEFNAGAVDLVPYMSSVQWGLPAEALQDYYGDFLAQDRFDGVQIALPSNRSLELLYYNDIGCGNWAITNHRRIGRLLLRCAVGPKSSLLAKMGVAAAWGGCCPRMPAVWRRWSSGWAGALWTNSSGHTRWTRPRCARRS